MCVRLGKACACAVCTSSSEGHAYRCEAEQVSHPTTAACGVFARRPAARTLALWYRGLHSYLRAHQRPLRKCICAGSMPNALRDVIMCTPCQWQATRTPPYKLFTCTYKCAMESALCTVHTPYNTVPGRAFRLTCYHRSIASAARPLKHSIKKHRRQLPSSSTSYSLQAHLAGHQIHAATP